MYHRENMLQNKSENDIFVYLIYSASKIKTNFETNFEIKIDCCVVDRENFTDVRNSRIFFSWRIWGYFAFTRGQMWPYS